MTTGNWQLKCAELKHRGAYLYKTKLWSDCAFQLNEVTIKAHKLIMAMASPEFSKILYGGVVNSPVPVHDVRAEVFNIMLEYIYTDNLNISSSKDACDLYHAAKTWRIMYIVRECVKYLSDHMNPKNVCHIYEVAWENGDRSLQMACEKIFSSKTKEILNDSSLYDAKLSTLSRLFSLDLLSIDNELDLYEAAIQYADEQDKRTSENGSNGMASNEECHSANSAESPPPAKKSRLSEETTARKEHRTNPTIEELSNENGEETMEEDSPSKHNSNATGSIEHSRIIRADAQKLKYQEIVKPIRFLTLTPREFADNATALFCLLTQSQMFALCMNISSLDTTIPMPDGFSTSLVPRTQATSDQRLKTSTVYRSIVHDIQSIKKYESAPFYARNCAWLFLILQCPSDDVLAVAVNCFYEAGPLEWARTAKVKVKFCTHKPVPKQLHKITLNFHDTHSQAYSIWMTKIKRSDILNPEYGFVDDFNSVTYKVYVNTDSRAAESPVPTMACLATSNPTNVAPKMSSLTPPELPVQTQALDPVVRRQSVENRKPAITMVNPTSQRVMPTNISPSPTNLTKSTTPVNSSHESTTTKSVGSSQHKPVTTSVAPTRSPTPIPSSQNLNTLPLATSGHSTMTTPVGSLQRSQLGTSIATTHSSTPIPSSHNVHKPPMATSGHSTMTTPVDSLQRSPLAKSVATTRSSTPIPLSHNVHKPPISSPQQSTVTKSVGSSQHKPVAPIRSSTPIPSSQNFNTLPMATSGHSTMTTPVGSLQRSPLGTSVATTRSSTPIPLSHNVHKPPTFSPQQSTVTKSVGSSQHKPVTTSVAPIPSSQNLNTPPMASSVATTRSSTPIPLSHNVHKPPTFSPQQSTVTKPVGSSQHKPVTTSVAPIPSSQNFNTPPMASSVATTRSSTPIPLSHNVHKPPTFSPQQSTVTKSVGSSQHQPVTTSVAPIPSSQNFNTPPMASSVATTRSSIPIPLSHNVHKPPIFLPQQSTVTKSVSSSQHVPVTTSVAPTRSHTPIPSSQNLNTPPMATSGHSTMTTPVGSLQRSPLATSVATTRSSTPIPLSHNVHKPPISSPQQSTVTKSVCSSQHKPVTTSVAPTRSSTPIPSSQQLHTPLITSSRQSTVTKSVGSSQHVPVSTSVAAMRSTDPIHSSLKLNTPPMATSGHSTMTTPVGSLQRSPLATSVATTRSSTPIPLSHNVHKPPISSPQQSTVTKSVGSSQHKPVAPTRSSTPIPSLQNFNTLPMATSNHSTMTTPVGSLQRSPLGTSVATTRSPTPIPLSHNVHKPPTFSPQQSTVTKSVGSSQHKPVTTSVAPIPSSQNFNTPPMASSVATTRSSTPIPLSHNVHKPPTFSPQQSTVTKPVGSSQHKPVTTSVAPIPSSQNFNTPPMASSVATTRSSTPIPLSQQLHTPPITSSRQSTVTKSVGSSQNVPVSTSVAATRLSTPIPSSQKLHTPPITSSRLSTVTTLVGSSQHLPVTTSVAAMRSTDPIHSSLKLNTPPITSSRQSTTTKLVGSLQRSPLTSSIASTHSSIVTIPLHLSQNVYTPPITTSRQSTVTSHVGSLQSTPILPSENLDLNTPLINPLHRSPVTTRINMPRTISVVPTHALMESNKDGLAVKSIPSPRPASVVRSPSWHTPEPIRQTSLVSLHQKLRQRLRLEQQPVGIKAGLLTRYRIRPGLTPEALRTALLMRQRLRHGNTPLSTRTGLIRHRLRPGRTIESIRAAILRLPLNAMSGGPPNVVTVPKLLSNVLNSPQESPNTALSTITTPNMAPSNRLPYVLSLGQTTMTSPIVNNAVMSSCTINTPLETTKSTPSNLMTSQISSVSLPSLVQSSLKTSSQTDTTRVLSSPTQIISPSPPETIVSTTSSPVVKSFPNNDVNLSLTPSIHSLTSTVTESVTCLTSPTTDIKSSSISVTISTVSYQPLHARTIPWPTRQLNTNTIASSQLCTKTEVTSSTIYTPIITAAPTELSSIFNKDMKSHSAQYNSGNPQVKQLFDDTVVFTSPSHPVTTAPTSFVPLHAFTLPWPSKFTESVTNSARAKSTKAAVTTSVPSTKGSPILTTSSLVSSDPVLTDDPQSTVTSSGTMSTVSNLKIPESSNHFLSLSLESRSPDMSDNDINMGECYVSEALERASKSEKLSTDEKDSICGKSAKDIVPPTLKEKAFLILHAMFEHDLGFFEKPVEDFKDTAEGRRQITFQPATLQQIAFSMLGTLVLNEDNPSLFEKLIDSQYNSSNNLLPLSFECNSLEMFDEDVNMEENYSKLEESLCSAEKDKDARLRAKKIVPPNLKEIAFSLLQGFVFKEEFEYSYEKFIKDLNETEKRDRPETISQPASLKQIAFFTLNQISTDSKSKSNHASNELSRTQTSSSEKVVPPSLKQIAFSMFSEYFF